MCDYVLEIDMYNQITQNWNEISKNMNMTYMTKVHEIDSHDNNTWN